MVKIKPPPADVYVGMEEYVSSSPGIGGFIKGEAGDFVVREVTPEGVVLDLESDSIGDMSPGDYTHFTLVKENWETNRAVKEIAQRLGVSRSRFAFAGTKDKLARTAQRMSVYRVPVDRLRSVRLKGLVLKDFSYSDESLGLGSLRGNRFTVRVRGVCAGAAERIRSVLSELEVGFPNYYGHQRFGEVRPITHEVGLHLLRGDFEAAVMTYLSRSFGGEDAGVSFLRGSLAADRDFKAALSAFPENLGYERAMLNHLVVRSGDWVGALRRLPKTLQKMFIHAYQGYVFNRALSECIRRGLYVERLPLVGFEVEADDVSAKILSADGVSQDDFRVAGMGELASRGEYRGAYAVAGDFVFRVDGDCVVFDFTLGRGSYATVLLREYMKN